jgi:hypothetical protein
MPISKLYPTWRRTILQMRPQERKTSCEHGLVDRGDL